MEKKHILDEIRRTAATNGGTPLGWRRFYAETGIRNTDWLGKLWPRWGDAVKEAGFEPNRLTTAYTEPELLTILAEYIRELGRFPVSAELRMKARASEGFPATNTFERMGNKRDVVVKLCAHLGGREEWADVLAICEPLAKTPGKARPAKESDASVHGFVYLIRSGKRYKLGATNDLATRSKAIGVQMPDPTKTEHVIRTDDPFGIEAYWHRRFAEKRTNGEWFDLTREDVLAFKRRKTM
jgi:hypothetical protein